MIASYEVLLSGIVVVWYFGRIIAIFDSEGRLHWRDENYPAFLVEYLMQQPSPTAFIWN